MVALAVSLQGPCSARVLLQRLADNSALAIAAIGNGDRRAPFSECDPLLAQVAKGVRTLVAVVEGCNDGFVGRPLVE